MKYLAGGVDVNTSKYKKKIDSEAEVPEFGFGTPDARSVW